ncbi:hypothetical protein N0V95_001007 [Ascochyta clinopodiicola]|nr:hypothetical protein N0V95_001007 [Ascochyta clinopodiicola]
MLQSDASEVSCPFGDNICFEGKAFEVKARPIDSRLHLGINARSEDRVIYDRQLTCAPLITKGYGQFVNDTDGTPTHIQYFYGAQGTLETENKPNHTYEYPLARKAAKISYQVEVHEHRVGGGPWWSPIEALSRSEGDMFIIFIEQNSVRHWKPNQDPVFRANKSVTLSETPMFESERYVSPIACYQQHRFCTPDHESCTSWGGRYEMLNITTKRPSGFTPTQLATASRLFFAALSTSIYETINSRPSMCLRAQDKMYWLYQMPLPDNQWQHEILSWAQEGLASLQAAVQEYAAGPSIALEGGYMKRMWHEKIPDNYVSSDRVYDKTWESMCHSQIVHDTQGTLNFALLGIAVILGLGILITILSFVIEPFTALVQRRFNVGATRADAWQRDESLQSLRLLFEKYNRGIWRGHSDLVPVTINANETFFYPLAHGIVEDSYQSLPNKEDDKSGRITA